MIADQLVRDEVLDIRQSFLVHAPAGSGKTSLLVQRFLSLLANVQQAPEEIIAITFTRKAVAEMRDRIISALQLGLQAAPAENDYKYKLWLLAQPVLARDQQESWNLIDNPARLKIQTIDSLCASITAQMPIISQFGAQPQIEPKPEALYEKAVDQLLQESTQPVAWQAEINTLLLHLANDRTRVKTLLVSMLEKREQWLDVIINNLSQQDVRQRLERSLALTIEQELASLEELVPVELDFDLLPEIDPTSIESWLMVADILLTKDNTWRATVTEKQGFPAPSKAKNKEEREQLKSNKDAMLRMLEKLKSHESFRQKLIAVTKLPPTHYTAAQWDILNALAVILRILVAQLIIIFKDSGQVDFPAVTLAALHALEAQDSTSDLALALDCKLRHILVDEFQDTSESQFKLLQQLTLNWEPYDARTLFIVGDPMQSIYRFRKADVGLFLKAKQYGINKIKLRVVQLTVNFRSTPQIVTWINKVFSRSFPAVDDITYGAISYMPAQAMSKALVLDEHDQSVECHTVDLETEAALLVANIQKIKRNTPNKSIAILVRSRKHLTKILAALRADNIAYQGVELESLKQRPLIQDLLALTKAILHLDDRIAWLSALRAPWCGLSLADLHILAQPQQTIWRGLQQPELLAKLSTDGLIRVKAFTRVMSAIILQGGRQTIDIQVQAAWQNLGGSQCLLDATAEQEAETYFNFLAEVATRRELFKQGFLERELDRLFLQPATVDHNAVQIMTMHKAKGLEFDIVMLPGLGQKAKNDEHKLLLIEKRNTPQDYLLIAPIKSLAAEQDHIYQYLAWSETQKQAYEDLRLLYVAATRAREKIYCYGAVGSDGPIANSLLAKIWPVIAAQTVINNSIDNLPHLLRNPVVYRLPSNWYADKNQLNLAVETVNKKLEPWQQDWLRLVGIVVHRVFWQIATDGIENWHEARILQQDQIWLQHLRQLGLNTLYNDQAIQLIRQAVLNTINDPLGTKILSSAHPESYAEWRLTVREYDQFKEIILDRAFMDQQGQFWIVDYKVVNDSTELSRAIEQYTPQILKYTKAVKNLRPGLKINAGLYFPLQARWHAVV